MSKPANTISDQPLSGAYSSLEQLLACRFAAREIQLKQRRRSLSQLAGSNKTAFRGRGLDFEEVRTYQAGDDIRNIDWRVTARLGGAYTKLFREERERPILLCIDQRQPMFFGSQHCFKSVSAAHIAATLSWAGLAQGDRVGGMAIGNDGTHEVRPRRSRQTVLALLRQLLQTQQQLTRESGIELDAAQSLVDALRDLRRIARPGSAVYLISDFSGYQSTEANKQLFQLARHCEVTAFFIFDPMEKILPPPGLYQVTDGLHRRLIDTASEKIRQQYLDQFEQLQLQLQQQLNQVGIPLIAVSTSDAPRQILQKYFGAQR